MVPIWNSLEEPFYRPDQVYKTTVAPHSRKGPHLHKVRRGFYFCARGSVRLRLRDDAGNYIEITLDENAKPVPILPGVECAIYNYGDEEALIINMPSPAWSKEEPDEWPVEEWQDPEGWGK